MFKNFFFLLLASVLVAGLQQEIFCQTLTANTGADDSTYQDPRVPVDDMIDQSLESGTITGNASDQSGSQVVAELRDASAEISVHMPKFDAAKVTQLQLLKLINWVRFLAQNSKLTRLGSTVPAGSFKLDFERLPIREICEKELPMAGIRRRARTGDQKA
jgi:hypothetical protein